MTYLLELRSDTGALVFAITRMPVQTLLKYLHDVFRGPSVTRSDVEEFLRILESKNERGKVFLTSLSSHLSPTSGLS